MVDLDSSFSWATTVLKWIHLAGTEASLVEVPIRIPSSNGTLQKRETLSDLYSK